MNGSVLPLLAVIVAALLLLGAVGAVSRSRARKVVGLGSAGLSGLAATVVLVALIAGDGPAQLWLPIGLPGSPFRLLLDPLSGFFALLVFSIGTAATAYATEADSAGLPVSPGAVVIGVAALALVALAGDAMLFATALALAGGAISMAGRTEGSAHAARSILLPTLLGAAAVVAVDWLQGGDASSAGFAAARAVRPPEALAVLSWIALVLGMAPLAGLAPLHRSASGTAETTALVGTAVLEGAASPLAFLALLRVTPALTGRPLPAWCGVALLLLGIASMLIGGIRATRGDTLGDILANGTARHGGLTAMALGLAIVARTLDLPQVAALALAALLMGAAIQAICGTLGVLCASAIQDSAATRHLARLGGLIHRMPVCTICLLVGLFGLAVPPPGPGFAVFWLLFQALLAAAQAAGPALQAVFVTAVAALGLGAALSIITLVRLIGVVCLGRPRTPRAAAARALPRAAARPLLCLAVGCLGLGACVGLVLNMLVNPAIHDILGAGLDPQASLRGIAAPGGGGYAALPVSALLVIAWGAAVLVRRRLQPAEIRAGPAWDGGYTASSPWLPFGDPLMQTTGVGFTPFAEDLPSPLRSVRWPTLSLAKWPKLSPLSGTAAAIVILALLLAIIRLMPR